MDRRDSARTTVEASSAPGARVPPQALEAEMSVLGAMMIEREAIGRASEILDSSDESLEIDRFFRRMNWAGNTHDAAEEL